MRSLLPVFLATGILALIFPPRQMAARQPAAKQAPAQAVPSASPPPDIVFTGEVERGKPYDHEIERKHGLERGLIFHLDPDADVGSGWNIEILKKGDLSDDRLDFISVATPPYHLFNQRYLSTAYDYTAKDAVALTPRHFYFVESVGDYKIADHEVNINLYPNHATSDEVDDADDQASKVKVGSGEFLILDSRITPATDRDNRGTIDWIKFEVRLTLHAGLSFRRVFARGTRAER
jgi:hypothetical protein